MDNIPLKESGGDGKDEQQISIILPKKLHRRMCTPTQ